MDARRIESRRAQLALPLWSAALRSLPPSQQKEIVVLLARLLREALGKAEAADEEI